MTSEISYVTIRKRIVNRDKSDGKPVNSHCLPFLPQCAVDELTDRHCVESTLRNLLGEGSHEQELQNLVNYVINNAGRTFLTLVHMEDVSECLVTLQVNRFTDEHFPIHEDPHSDTRVCSIYSSRPSTELSKWSCKQRDNFLENQWIFTVPRFRQAQFEYDFHCKRRLPFVNLNHDALHTGHFGTVHRVGLRAEHTDFDRPDMKLNSTPEHIEVALKVMDIQNSGKADTDIEKFYNKELETLNRMRELAHPHLVPAIAAYKKGTLRCFVFPWAQGGNLKKFWQDDKHALDKDLVIWAIRQMLGISEGIEMLHRHNTRHGDIKPENILHYADSAQNSSFGFLMVADVGLAKVHKEYTRLRDPGTTTRHGTMMYEPIEMSSYSTGKSISRRYDVWGLGCIFLEFTIWLLYGQKELRKFRQELTDRDAESRRFWEKPDTPGSFPRRHPMVDTWMEKINDDVRSECAVRSLVEVISSRLLVAIQDSTTDDDDSSTNGTSTDNDRATAFDLVGSLRDICDEGPKTESYYFDSRMQTLAAQRAESEADTTTAGQELVLNSNQRTSKLDNEWRTIQDNSWARILVRRLGCKRLKPPAQNADLCGFCRVIDFFAARLSLGRSLGDLEGSAMVCPMCRFLHACLSKVPLDHDEIVDLSIDLDRNSFSLSHNPVPIISIYADPEIPANPPFQAQPGMPFLPKPGSSQQFNLLNEWVHLCNEYHCCVSSQADNGTGGALPTRLIDLGTSRVPSMHLIETKDDRTPGRYVALSHCWGTLQSEDTFCTHGGNIDRFKNLIPFDYLPRTFQDAVIITRALGVRYLWIDSLCIIQGDDKDWKTEAGKMEDVFSSAYCTIAASSSTSSFDGFLLNRAQRPAIGIQSSKGTLYLAEAIDDFQAHVEQAILNTRGWVLQERALSRRTIHFTSTQVYWECGRGVHCETLAELGNRQSMFLGDSHFPTYGLEHYKDERIRLVQYLYQTYSGLNLTKPDDRPKAILGLQKRLGSTFKSKAIYGVISKYFERTFLWQANVPRSLSQIDYESGQKVPSWSWMAVMGRIRYMDIPFGEVAWTGDLENPFKLGFDENEWNGRLVAKAKRLVIDDGEFEERCNVDLSLHKFEPNNWKCVVVGESKIANEDGHKNQYVLLIRETSSGVTPPIYERVGVGILLPMHVAMETTIIYVA